jgi:hypothetical protein
MLVRVYRIEESGDELAFYVYFGGVIYFEGPLQWSGADFISGSEEECIGILRRMGVKHAEEAVRSDYYRLFRVKLSQLEVRIVATAAVKLDESEVTERFGFREMADDAVARVWERGTKTVWTQHRKQR